MAYQKCLMNKFKLLACGPHGVRQCWQKLIIHIEKRIIMYCFWDFAHPTLEIPALPHRLRLQFFPLGTIIFSPPPLALPKRPLLLVIESVDTGHVSQSQWTLAQRRFQNTAWARDLLFILHHHPSPNPPSPPPSITHLPILHLFLREGIMEAGGTKGWG